MTEIRGMDRAATGPARSGRMLRALGLDGARRADLFVLCLVMAVAALFRFWHVQQPLVDAFSWREASTAMMADNFRTGSWNILFPEVSWTGPGPSYQGREFQLLSYSVALLHEVFGWHDWFGRAVASAFAMITVLSLHRLAALVWDERHAHAVAFAYAVMPGAIVIDSSFLPDPAMLAFVTLGIWLFVRHWAEGGRRLIVFAAGAVTLGALCKLPGLSAGLVVGWLLLVWFLRGERVRVWISLLAGLVALVLIADYYAWAVYLGSSYPPYHVAGSGYVWDWGLRGFVDQSFFLPSAWKIAVWWFYGYPYLALMLIGLWTLPTARSLGRDPALVSVPVVWLLGGAVVYLAAAREITSNPWNFHVLHIPFAFLAGRGCIALAEMGGARLTSVLGVGRLAVIAVLVVGWSTLPLTERLKQPQAEDGRLLGGALAQMRAPGDLSIAFGPEVGDPIALYYSRGRGWVFPPGGGDIDWSLFSDDDATAIAQLEELRAAGARWFGFTRNAKDRKDRYFMEHHAGVVDHLLATASLVADDPRFLIFRLEDVR